MESELINTPAIPLDLFESEIEIVAEAYSIRQDAIIASEAIVTISDEFEAKLASNAMISLKNLEKEIEASRKAAKDPALQLGKRIDATAKEFIESVKAETTRISRVLGAYQVAERQKKIEAEKLAREKERQELVAAEIAQQERIQKENAGRTGTLNEDLEDIAEETSAKVTEIKQEAASKHGAIKGVKVRTVIKFEIKDVDELHKARPDLFTPDESKIRAALKLTKNIPGLDIWEETKAY